MKFYVGLHHASDAQHFERACINVKTLARRQKPITARILLDSGAFREVVDHGGYRDPVDVYAAQIERLAEVMPIDAAVCQDFMCEPFALRRTGLTVADHQRLTIERYDALTALQPSVPILPVLQGWLPEDYAAHVRAYGARLREFMWVGVGSVCKRNASPLDIANVLGAIKTVRPDLQLHGFGVKKTALLNSDVRSMLYSADSAAWSFAARYEGRNAHDWREAAAYAAAIDAAAARPLEGFQTTFEFASYG